MLYRLSAIAEEDLDEIWSYVAEDASPTTADRLSDANFDRFELLVEQPRMGRNRPEFGRVFVPLSSRAMSSTIGTTRTS
jgi:plasmid stabilization system protein ParE